MVLSTSVGGLVLGVLYAVGGEEVRLLALEWVWGWISRVSARPMR